MSLKTSRILCELAFALHLSFACTSGLIRTVSYEILRLGYRMEFRLNALFGIENTDVIRGYFLMWVPAVTFAFGLWALWRLICRSQLLRNWSFGLPFAGIVIVLTPPLLFGETPISQLQRGGDVVVLGAVAGCLLVFLFCRWRAAPAKVIIPGFAVLYSFWFLQRGPNEWPTYDGPTGPILGFCAAAAWGLYVAHPARRVSDDASRI